MAEHPDNRRLELRKSLFAQATLHFIDGFCSVKLRNIAATGALIEAERLPRSGTPVELRRGTLKTLGTVIWRRNGKAGIEFIAQTDVRLWMPHAVGQGAVDHAFQVFKGAPAAAFVKPVPTAAITYEDIEGAAELLDELADTFAADAGVLFNYSAKLQALDVASQMLRKLALQVRDRRTG